MSARPANLVSLTPFSASWNFGQVAAKGQRALRTMLEEQPMSRTLPSSSDDGGVKAPRRPTIITSFSGYEPPFDLVPIVRRMLESVPEHFLFGLGAIVLINSSALTGKRRRGVFKSRRGKVRAVEARGLYHPAFSGSRAWIELFVDNTLRGWENGWWLRIALLRESKVGDVLFHELGHHIHFTHRPERREKEDVADVWKVRLQKRYTNERFWWMATLGRLLRPILGSFIGRKKADVELQMLRSREISRAEYEEATNSRG